MADFNFDDYGRGMSDGQPGLGRGQSILNITGAVMSLSLVLSFGFWGYSIAMRDVTGIPVLRAMSEPMRISPVDPGGDSASHQGLTVNAVAAVGTVADMPDQLILAPSPIALIDEDEPGMGMLVSAEALLLADAGAENGAAVETASNSFEQLAPVEIAMAEVGPLDPSQADAVALALAAALGEEVAPPEEPLIDPGALGLASSPRPKARAATGGVAVVTAESPDLTNIREVLPADIPVGTRLVQLGAFDEAEAARREWLRLSGQFGDLMADKSLVVQEATSGGHVFFRLRAHGFADEDQARQFCAAILAEGASCIPIAQR